MSSMLYEEYGLLSNFKSILQRTGIIYTAVFFYYKHDVGDFIVFRVWHNLKISSVKLEKKLAVGLYLTVLKEFQMFTEETD